ncbi:MAG: alpha/beta hydrolase [Bacteroidota bacterium]
MHPYQFTQQGVSPRQAQRAIILIHGRGAPPEDILGLADFFDDGKTWFAAPEAHNYTWYPYSFLMPAAQNQPWLNSAIENIARLIDEARENFSDDNIFIMGFSQGACLTAEVTARNARKYGGIAVFTGGLIGNEIDTTPYKGNFEGTKVYISNGSDDPHIPRQRSEDTNRIMQQMGADTTLEIFPGRVHTISMEEIRKVQQLFFG